MASVTAIANPEAGSEAAQPAGAPRRRRAWGWPGSRLGRLIVALNLLGLTILIGGALVLNELSRGLIHAKSDRLTTQGAFLANVIGTIFAGVAVQVMGGPGPWPGLYPAFPLPSFPFPAPAPNPYVTGTPGCIFSAIATYCVFALSDSKGKR